MNKANLKTVVLGALAIFAGQWLYAEYLKKSAK